MTENEVIEYCLSLDGAFKRYPYGDGSNPLVMSIPPKKAFCNIHLNSSPLHITVKCDPIEAQFLRSAYSCIKPGYYCNKEHWNSIFIDGTLTDEQIKSMILNSYYLVSKKKHKTQSF